MTPPTQEQIDSLIGISEQRAETLIHSWGYISRIVGRDHESYILTADLRWDRINLTIREGTVRAAGLG